VDSCRRKTEPVPNMEEQEKAKKQKGEVLRRRRQERRQYDEMVVNAGLLKYIKDPSKENLRDAIKNVSTQTRRVLSRRRQG
jgi:hypothetical protein